MSFKRTIPSKMFSLLLLALGGGCLAFGVYNSVQASLAYGQLPPANTGAQCDCHDSRAEFNLNGPGQFTGQFDGSISVRVGAMSTDPNTGLRSVDLHVLDYATFSNIPGIGPTNLYLNPDVPSSPSTLRENAPGNSFPATQTMILNILMTTDAVPGVIFRTMTPGVLVNSSTQSFPPGPGAVYSLQAPVALEDTADPGVAIGEITSVNTTITSSKLITGMPVFGLNWMVLMAALLIGTGLWTLRRGRRSNLAT